MLVFRHAVDQTRSLKKYTQLMRTRAPLSLLVLLALVFNQVAASIHVVEHVTPAVAYSGSSTLHGDHSHGSLQTPGGHQNRYYNEFFSPTEHTDNTISCLFYHVLLATPGSLTTGLNTDVSPPGLQLQTLSTPYLCLTTATGPITIRGPPDDIRT